MSSKPKTRPKIDELNQYFASPDVQVRENTWPSGAICSYTYLEEKSELAENLKSERVENFHFQRAHCQLHMDSQSLNVLADNQCHGTLQGRGL